MTNVKGIYEIKSFCFIETLAILSFRCFLLVSVMLKAGKLLKLLKLFRFV